MSSATCAAALLIAASMTVGGCHSVRPTLSGSLPLHRVDRADRAKPGASVPDKPPDSAAEQNTAAKADPAGGSAPVQPEAGAVGTTGQRTRPAGTNAPWAVTTITQSPPKAPTLSGSDQTSSAIGGPRRLARRATVVVILLSAVAVAAVVWSLVRRRVAG